MSGGPGGVSRLKLGGKGSFDEQDRRGEKLTAGVPLAKLIKRRLADAPEVVMLGHNRSVAAEQFRRLKTLIINEHRDDSQVLVITSAAPGEGKSMVSLNLALAFAADREGEVLLLDADLRRPTVEHFLTPRPKLGVSELLLGQTEIEHAVLDLENSPLKILPAGAPPHDPVELLASSHARALVATLRKSYARIIIDTPPIIPFTDADAIGGQCDGALLVVRSGTTRSAMVQQALNAVTSTRVLGIVLNDATFNLADRDYYYYERGYYAYYDRERAKP